MASSKEAISVEANKLKAFLEGFLKEPYSHAKTQEWCSAISDEALKLLEQFKDKYKVVVNVLMMEKTDGGFKTSSSMIWDEKKDDVVSIRYENATTRVIVTMYVLSLA